MHWYFANKCAGLFPWRHSFQTHYQYDKATPENDIGEQPGVRPYSKGHGPIGAPVAGLTWRGDRSWFITGVPSDAIPDPLPCPLTLVGTIPFPPPDTWDGPFFRTAFSSDDWSSGEVPANAGSYLDWYVLEFGIDPHDPESVITAHWHYVEGQGMVLYFGFSEDPDSVYPVKSTEFVNVTEFEDVTIWNYSYTDIHGIPQTMRVEMFRCTP